MTKYKVSSINTGQLLLILLSIGILVQINLFILRSEFFLKGDSIFLFFLVLLYPVIILVVWLLFQKFKDKIGVSEFGIESDKLGQIKWEEIQFCSWESHRSSTESIFIKLKNKKRFTISNSSWQTLNEDNVDDLKKIFQQIKIYQKRHTFGIKKNRFFYTLGIGLLTFFLLSVLMSVLIY